MRKPLPGLDLYISPAALLSYGMALMLNAVPLPSPWSLLVPPFGLLVLYFWAMEDLHATHFASAVVIGLLYDALYGSLLGVHALMFSVMLFVLLKIRVPLRLASPLQQALFLTPLLLIYQVLTLLLAQPLLNGDEWYFFFAMPLTLFLFWPLIRFLLERVLLRPHVAS